MLIHGGFQGGFVWQPIADRLRDRGHRVWTPSLTGLGDRTHLAGPGVGLATHVRDIENVLYYEDLQDVILVGFSYGGMVVAGLGEEAARRTRAVLLLDAAFPDDGQSIRDAYAHIGDETLPEEVRKLHAAADGGKAQGLPDLPVPPQFAGDPRLSPMPAGSHWDRSTRGTLVTSVPGYYLHCTEYNTRCAQRAADLGWTVWTHEATTHHILAAEPDLVFDCIERVAAA